MTDVLDAIAGGARGSEAGESATTAGPGTGLAAAAPSLGEWSAQTAPGPNAMFAGEGTGFSSGRVQRRAQRMHNYNEELIRAAQLYKQVRAGDKRAALDFSEAMSTSDFPLLFGDILSRQIVGFYNSIRMPWELTARRSLVPDFREVKRLMVDGAEGLLSNVPELTNYPADSLRESDFGYRVSKRGKRLPLSWEARINDDLDAFGRMPQRLALSARRTEEHFATSLYVDPTGPNSTFFSAGHGNIVTGNPVLSIDSVTDALTQLASQTDDDEMPIFIDGYVLEVPQSLEVVANNIINAIQVDAASGGGDNTGNNILRVNNWLAGKLKVKVNPWLTFIDRSANRFSTWYLWANPGDGRPAQEIGFLVGHENPEMFMKAPNALRIGGGTADVMDGDFDSDAIEWKIRHVLGGTMFDYRMLMVSKGTGTP
jgi:hypothetical protein